MPSELHQRLGENLASVRARMAAACGRASRSLSEVTLVAVTKYARWEWVRALVDLGVRDFGENRPQQFVERTSALAQQAPDAGVRWHLIGHLQRNKVRPVLPAVHLIHSVDSLRLLERIDLLARELSLLARVLLEVNVSGEGSKDGFAPDVLRDAWPQLVDLRNISISGLMTMAPESDDPDSARPTFAALRELRDDLNSRGGPELFDLSMGMSGDFETAIEEGATLIRLGSVLFEGLDSLPEDANQSP